jgi:hypothetical protein
LPRVHALSSNVIEVRRFVLLLLVDDRLRSFVLFIEDGDEIPDADISMLLLFVVDKVEMFFLEGGAANICFTSSK